LIAEVGTMDRREHDSALHRESAPFLSTHLLRELISADARSEAAGDPLADRAEALLAAVLAGLELAEGAIVQGDPDGAAGLCLAARGVPDHARELLEARLPHLENLGGSLVQRALSERRVLLLDRATRDPLVPALRDGNPDIECAAVVPLIDHGLPVGVLLLAARGGRLTSPLLRSLAVAFRLLGLLLAPGRGRAEAVPARADDPVQGSADSERYLFEIEELTARLGEAREAARQMEERASRADAALRAEIESSRAHTAVLEAQLAGATPTSDRELELDNLCAAQVRVIEEQEQRLVELEREAGVLLERIAEQADAHPGTENGSTTWDTAALDDDQQLPGDDESEPEATIDLGDGDGGDEQLGEIAAAAAAALEHDGAADEIPGEGSPALEPTEQEVGLDALASPGSAAPQLVEPEVAFAILHLDSRQDAQSVARESANDVGAAYWCGEGAVPRAATSIVAVNLLDEELAHSVAADAAVWSTPRWIVYGADAETGLGFELTSCALLRRPIDARCCLEQIQRRTTRKLNGILLVSAQLREVAALRQALQEVDAAGSVACDTRQALDLLEIVRRPDAILIDLALPQGQGLALAALLRRQPETSDLPLLLLLPAVVEPARMRAEAEKAQLLGPFVAEDVHRLVRATLAGRH